MKRFATAALAVLLASCSSSSGARRQEVTVSTSEKAQDILGMKILLSDMRDRRENLGLHAWSFHLKNNEKDAVMIRAVPLFLAPDGRELGGAAEAQEAPVAPGQDKEFYFQAPTAEATKLLVKFELK